MLKIAFDMSYIYVLNEISICKTKPTNVRTRIYKLLVIHYQLDSTAVAVIIWVIYNITRSSNKLLKCI